MCNIFDGSPARAWLTHASDPGIQQVSEKTSELKSFRQFRLLPRSLPAPFEFFFSRMSVERIQDSLVSDADSVLLSDTECP